MSSLQAFYSGAFTDPTPTLNEVLVASTNATSQNIVSSANITAVDITSTSDVFASNVTSTGTMTIQKPLVPSYSLLSYPVPAGSVGSMVSVQETVGLPFSTTGSAVWAPLFTSATVLPLGIYMISVKTLFESIPQSGDFGLGVVSDSTSTQPAYGTPTEFRNVPSDNNFTCCFVSSTGFQSPKFLYLSDTAGVTINQVEWTAVKIG